MNANDLMEKISADHFKAFIDRGMLNSLEIDLDCALAACKLFARDTVVGRSLQRTKIEQELLRDFHGQLMRSGIMEKEPDIAKPDLAVVDIPKAFEQLLGREYWQQASEKQLWAWIEAIGTSRSNGDSLQDAIEACGSEDWLLAGNPCLDRFGKNHGPDATWLEIFGNEHRMMWKRGKFTRHDYVCLVTWCARRLEELEKKKEVA